jgi:hypothetical protein
LLRGLRARVPADPQVREEIFEGLDVFHGIQYRR